ncbi:hypothetical protein [Flavobacterium sp. AED]|uniref:hypothetical protein n=1 Tax=Flavobacterium sp. AED TaxID=1423323 RepID=UPI00057E83E7|nr:hypothetical protein [Flavobacterium sp. AED]KIA86485.1 hypothetical protein OA85_02110 [Flavobacterium sp. AED]
MEYEELVDSLSEKTGINRNLFNLDFEESNKNGLILIDGKDVHNYFFSRYEYWQNSDYGGWKSIALYVPNGIITEFLTALNQVFEELDEETIDLDNIPEEFTYSSDDGGFNVLLGQSKGEYYRIEFAQPNK